MLSRLRTLGRKLTLEVTPDQLKDAIRTELNIGLQIIPDEYLSDVVADAPGQPLVKLKRLLPGVDPETALVFIYEGTRGNQRVIVKWLSENSLDNNDEAIDRELINWKKFQDTGVQTPKVYYGYQILGMPVLVMELLQPLAKMTPSQIQIMGIQIVEQLRGLHQFACHSDIKPANILTKQGRYYLIDMADLSDEIFQYGYHRRSYTPLFTSQVSIKYQVTTPKYDLIELGLTMSFLSDQNSNIGYSLAEINFRNIIDNPIVQEYMAEIMSVPETEVTPEVYDRLIEILRKKFKYY